jgi:hypothetical protein
MLVIVYKGIYLSIANRYSFLLQNGELNSRENEHLNVHERKSRVKGHTFSERTDCVLMRDDKNS